MKPAKAPFKNTSILELVGTQVVACPTVAAYNDVRSHFPHVLVGSIKPLTTESFPRTYRLMVNDPKNSQKFKFWKSFADRAEDTTIHIDEEKLRAFNQTLITITFGSIDELIWVKFFL